MNVKKPAKTRIKAVSPTSQAGVKIIESSVTAEMIEERARELSLIAGRKPDEITVNDREQASRELHGLNRPASPSNDDPSVTGWDWGSPVPSTGQQASPTILPDEAQLAEELVDEGVNDAEHDQMVAARKARK